MPTYQGKKVKVTEIKQNEPGYDPNDPKVKITKDDGTEETVSKSQVQN